MFLQVLKQTSVLTKSCLYLIVVYVITFIHVIITKLLRNTL